MHTLQVRRACVLVAAFAMLGLGACGERQRDADTLSKADPSAIVVGTTPAEPSGDPPGTTPVAVATSDVSKAVEQSSMPLPGQPNDHSNLAANPSQRAETTEVNKSPAVAQTANSEKPSERGQQQ